MTDSRVLQPRCLVAVLVAILSAAAALYAGDRPLTFEDLMKFRQIQDASISEDGAWVAYALIPDRGDGEAVAQSTTSDTIFRALNLVRLSTPTPATRCYCSVYSSSAAPFGTSCGHCFSTMPTW